MWGKSIVLHTTQAKWENVERQCKKICSSMAGNDIRAMNDLIYIDFHPLLIVNLLKQQCPWISLLYPALILQSQNSGSVPISFFRQRTLFFIDLNGSPIPPMYVMKMLYSVYEVTHLLSTMEKKTIVPRCNRQHPVPGKEQPSQGSTFCCVPTCNLYKINAWYFSALYWKSLHLFDNIQLFK